MYDLLRPYVTSCDSVWPAWPRVTLYDLLVHCVTSCDSAWPRVTKCGPIWPPGTFCDLVWLCMTLCDLLGPCVCLRLFPMLRTNLFVSAVRPRDYNNYCKTTWQFKTLVRSTMAILHSYTHTHPFNGPFSVTTRVSRYQKGKTNLDFTEARDSEWQWHQLGHMQVCISLQMENHASTPLLSFLQAGCPSCCPTNSVKALKAYTNGGKKQQIYLSGQNHSQM